ncbi:MAG TPA: MerR family transcriptional regulator [Propionibacteriaceae bacterium]|nr:MerR family transcriptional regulator [Propionibacteriaceae bacterium]
MSLSRGRPPYAACRAPSRSVVATIKFYLREKLLHEGVRTAATQAQYDQSHVARLRLIRALIGPGGLSIAAAHQVIQAIEEPPGSVHELLGVAAGAVAGPNLDDALRALDEAGFTLPEGALDLYQDHMRQIAEFEIDNVPTESPAAAVRYVVLGTVLLEPVILALRRAAEEEASARRFG